MSLFAAVFAVAPKVLIVGASGGTGMRVLRGFLDAAFEPSQLRVLTRDLSKLDRLRHLGMETVAADLDIRSSLHGVASSCTHCYIHSTAGDTRQLDAGEVARAYHLAMELQAERSVEHVLFNSAAAEPTHRVRRIAQKHQVERVFSDTFGRRVTNLRAHLFMEELWKDYTRPSILDGTFSFSVPSDRPLYLTSVRDMGRVAASCMTGTLRKSRVRTLNVASDLLTPAEMATEFSKAQNSPCVHKDARSLRWMARFFLPDLHEVLHFYRTSLEVTDIEALEREFPVLTTFEAFLHETGWGNATATYADLGT